MGFSIGAFVGGFAEKAVEIEEQSAKIGVALLKEAMDDFREEAKDFKPKRLAELKNKKDQAKFLRGLFEKKGDTPGKHDAKIKVLLDGGDTVVQNFINKAEKARAFQNLDSVSSLITLGEGHAAATGSGFDLIDYIDSGVYATVNAPIYGGPEGMTTGVFGRDISLGGKAGSVDSIKSAYIPDAEKYTGDVPTSMGATVNLKSSVNRGAFEVPTINEVKSLQAIFGEEMALYAGIATGLDRNGDFMFATEREDAKVRLSRDANEAYQQWLADYEGSDKKINSSTIKDYALSYVTMLNAREMANLKDPESDVFYANAVGLQSLLQPNNESTPANPPGVDAPVVQEADAGTVKFTREAFLADPNVSKYVNPSFESKLNKRDRAAQISAIAQSKFGLTKESADKIAAAVLQ